MSAHRKFQTNTQTIAFQIAGDGPPLLLLHGFPQNRAMWDPLIPTLSARHTVVWADLRGYGDSPKPASVSEMSFRPMAEDMVELMAHLGFARFHVAGHDRGARVAHRMALDHPDVVHSLCVMDIVPTEHLLTHLTTEAATAYYHWFFLAQPHPFPENLIGFDPDAYFERCLLGFGKATLDDFAPEQLQRYRTSWRDPACIRAMCDDYRAAIEVDWALDTSDLDRAVSCPALVLYGADGAMAQLMDVPATWRNRLSNMVHQPITGGHFFPDQSPQETSDALLRFLEKSE